MDPASGTRHFRGGQAFAPASFSMLRQIDERAALYTRFFSAGSWVRRNSDGLPAWTLAAFIKSRPT
jgi:hypothetical protein